MYVLSFTLLLSASCMTRVDLKIAHSVHMNRMVSVIFTASISLFPG